MPAFIHPQAIVESTAIGDRTRVWAFAHILPGARIGENCNICDHTFIENDVVIGNNVTIKCGVYLWDGIELEDDVFVGPNATFTNDPFPRSKAYPERFTRTVVRKGASIGANATILPGVVIGAGAMVGAGAVVTRNVPPGGIAKGNPAQLDSYVTARQIPGRVAEIGADEEPAALRLKVAGARLHTMPIVDDLRGSLTFGQFDQHLPFPPRRFFVVYNVPNSKVHGEHAHRTLQQFLVCLRGSVHVNVDDGAGSDTVILNSPGIGLYVPPLVWSRQYRYTADAMLLVLASEVYDEREYIRDYQEFLALRQLQPRPGDDPLP